ncbi:oligosaccharide flippase family protein [Trabulsiella odontotermitis]|uniref:oligosaccharide flippase family protein n=1 Tax=Trabulsiella odontotermitis TaxID=379893 RepID=UPI0024B692EF|nr:oligosaccharide flippase family protein [Trabulsiella odontotermitis]WHP29874.1 oligosaccharide flippase family protein [Trabulsiella odontotermitis]
MSFKKNIIANYVSQIYVSAIGILILPLYIKYMGAEAYGLIGFFTMLQSWFTLLDLGLTPTIGRETARYYGGSTNALDYRKLLRALNVIFVSIAVVGGGLLFFSAGDITKYWLHINTLPLSEVVLSIKVIAVCVALRWLCGLYRGVITGAEKLIWLSSFNVVICTLRFIFVFFTMYIFGFTPVVFFLHQFTIAIIEFSGFFFISRHLIPGSKGLGKIGWSFRPVRSVLTFSLTIAFTSSIWVMITQTDKLVLSGILSLKEYGHFTLAVLVASGIMIISGPISTALLPRFARLHAEGSNDKLLALYNSTTQLVCVIASSTSVVLAFCSEPLLYIWTGDRGLAHDSAPILSAYAVGNGLLAVSAFPYYLQYARGKLKYHFVGNLVMLFSLIPLIVFMAKNYGGVGAGYAWVFTNLLYLLVWVGFVHSKLEPGLHIKWFFNNIVRVYIPVIITGYVFNYLYNFQFDRIKDLLMIVLLSSVSLGIAVLSSSEAMKILRNKLTKNEKPN